MVITVKQAYEFQLEQFITPGDLITLRSRPNVAVLDSVIAFPGSEQTVPDWVAFAPLFIIALASGLATIVTAPTGNVTLNAGTTSANVELPATGSNVVVTNTGSNTAFGASPAWVLLGNSSVTVTTATGLQIPAGSTVMLPLGSNTFLAAIGLQTDDLLNVAVV
jgi:hypothetical protein